MAKLVVNAFMRWAASSDVSEVFVEAAPTDQAYGFWCSFLAGKQFHRYEYEPKWEIPTDQFA